MRWQQSSTSSLWPESPFFTPKPGLWQPFALAVAQPRQRPRTLPRVVHKSVFGYMDPQAAAEEEGEASTVSSSAAASSSSRVNRTTDAQQVLAALMMEREFAAEHGDGSSGSSKSSGSGSGSSSDEGDDDWPASDEAAFDAELTSDAEVAKVMFAEHRSTAGGGAAIEEEEEEEEEESSNDPRRRATVMKVPSVPVASESNIRPDDFWESDSDDADIDADGDDDGDGSGTKKIVAEAPPVSNGAVAQKFMRPQGVAVASAVVAPSPGLSFAMVGKLKLKAKAMTKKLSAPIATLRSTSEVAVNRWVEAFLMTGWGDGREAKAPSPVRTHTFLLLPFLHVNDGFLSVVLLLLFLSSREISLFHTYVPYVCRSPPVLVDATRTSMPRQSQVSRWTLRGKKWCVKDRLKC